MRQFYLIALSLIITFRSDQLVEARNTPQAPLSGNVSLLLQQGVWKTEKTGITYQNITLDIGCRNDICEREIWGYAPQFNQADHQGIVTVNRLNNGWQLQVKLKINRDPWLSYQGKANYIINLDLKKNQLIGHYSGTFNEQPVKGEVIGNISPIFPKTIPNHRPISSQEHPRLIFRQEELSRLRQTAKTDYGKAILKQLQRTLNEPIYYQGYVPNGGYHAAGYCFLALLNQDKQAAETAWQISQNSINQPGSRLFEQSIIVAGIALAYDLCYPIWNTNRRQSLAHWLAEETEILIAGTPDRGWNPNPWSNWNARARAAAGLAALAILKEPQESFPQGIDIQRLLTIAERNITRYLLEGIGDRGFGSEGDHYTTEPLILTVFPFFQAARNVVGKDFLQGASAEWILPQYLTRIIEKNDQLLILPYGRHHYYAGKSLFAMGLGTASERFLPAIIWLFNRHFGMEGDQTFAINSPQDAIFAFVGYRTDIIAKNPAEILNRVLVDKQKGFYLFRNRWQDSNDFVTSIYLKRQFLRGSWSFPEAGSFRIWGLGNALATAGFGDGKRENENVVITDKLDNPTSQPIFFQANTNGSGVVSLKNENWLRCFAVDYSGLSGVPGLFVVVDKFTDKQTEKTWIMHTEGNVTIKGQKFIIQGENGATLQGTFITPKSVNLSFQANKEGKGGKILAKGNNQFFVVMTAQTESPPSIQISGTGLAAKVIVGKQKISFHRDRILL